MFFRKVNVSDECMNWLRKSESFDVKPKDAQDKFNKRCNEIQEDVIRAVMTKSQEPASPDGKAEVVVEVSVTKGESLDVTKIVTSVYAVVYTKNRRKYYVIFDEETRQLKRVAKIHDVYKLYINGGDFVENLRVIDQKSYRISM